MTTKRYSSSPFRTNTQFTGKIYGDLAHMLHLRKFRKYRFQTFTTDSAGFRNPSYKPETSFQIVTVGDSDMAGSSQSDEDTFSSQLGKRLKKPVYNYAANSPLRFLADKRFQQSPPKIVIWEQVERTIKPKAFSALHRLPENASFKEATPKWIGEPPLPRFIEHFTKNFYAECLWIIARRHTHLIGHIDHSSGMLFYNEGIIMAQRTPDQWKVKVLADGVEKIQRLMAKRGVILLYMPLPDKENIYRELLPEGKRGVNKSIFLLELMEELQKRNIGTISLYDTFREQVPLFLQSSQPEKSLYFLDDTHWNRNGVRLAVDKTVEKLTELGYLSLLE